jgi:hypothetical protein
MKTTTNSNGLNPEIVDQFIIEVTLIDPIVKIIGKLEKGEFGDRDVKWLDSKLEKFADFACKTLFLTIPMPEPMNGKVLNDYTTKQYISRFNTLLEYFKSL